MQDEGPGNVRNDLSSMVADLMSNRTPAKKNVEKGGRPPKNGEENTGKKSVDKPKGKGKPEDEKTKSDSAKTGKKREWKATALRKGWLGFRADYVKKNASSGKTVQELNKAAGAACLP